MRVHSQRDAQLRRASATLQWRHMCAAGLAFTLIFAMTSLAGTSPARSQDCAMSVDGTTALCGTALPDLTFDQFSNAYAAPAPQPANPKAAARSAPAETPAPIPFSLNATDKSVTARTSLGSWREYNAKLTARKIEEAKASAQQPLAVPSSAAASASPFEIWSSVDAQGTDNDTERVKASAGADYKFGPSTTVGVIAERGGSSGTTASGPQSNEKIGAYVIAKPAAAFSIDARTQWERNDSGAAVSRPGALEKSSLIVAPSIKQPFAIGGGKTVEPYVTLKREFDVGGGLQGSQNGAVTSVDSAGAGVTFAKPDAYSLSLSTDVDGIGGQQSADVKSQMQFKLPLR